MVVRAFYLIGLASYSLYATHAPVFRTINLLTGNYRSQSILWPFACTLAAVAFAQIFFYLIERYTIRSPRQVDRARAANALPEASQSSNAGTKST